MSKSRPCPRCGLKIIQDLGWNYCPKCGAPIEFLFCLEYETAIGLW